jgi:dienelactone hydrolase
VEHRAAYYGGRSWANELALRGYAVLVHDVFPFGSRRIKESDVNPEIRAKPSTGEAKTIEGIIDYDRWAASHESIVAKSLFCSGTTWPGVYLHEDRAALDYLLSREEVDSERVGCCGLSGGGMRTAYLAGLDHRVRAAVCVGFMTTWRDFLLHKSHTHTWMAYTPLLPRLLDFPEVAALRVPLPLFVQNNSGDELFTLPEMERAASILGAIYRKAEALDNLRVGFYPGPHKFDLEMQKEAFDWLSTMLST